MRFTKLDNGVLRADDESGSTNLVTVTAGENLTANDMVYISVGAADGGRTSGQAYKLDATNDNRIEFVGVVTATATSGNPVIIQVSGDIDGFTGLNVGKPIYASVTVPGNYQNSAPNTSGQWMIQLGVASSATNIAINAAGSATAVKITSESEPINPSEINYILNPIAAIDVSGWNLYKDADQTAPENGTGGTSSLGWSRTTATPLRGTASFLLSKTGSVSERGEGVSTDFTIARSDRAKMLRIAFDYEVLSGVYANDMAVWIFDTVNNTLIQPSGYIIESSGSGIVSRANMTFQTASNSENYRLILHTITSTTQNYEIEFDNFIVGPQVVPMGAPVTDWVSYTPSVTAISGTLTNFTAAGFWRRNGDTADYKIRLIFNTSVVGTWSNPLFSLPSGQVIDNIKIPGGNIETFQSQTLGTATDAGTQTYALSARPYTTTTVIAQQFFVSGSGINLNSLSQASPFTWTTNDEIEFEIRQVPIVGWSSSTVVSSSADTRVVAARLTTPTAGSFSALTTVSFAATATIDTHGMYNGSNTLTCRVPGIYKIGTSMLTNTLTQGATGAFEIYYRVNGGGSIRIGWVSGNGAAGVNYYTSGTDTVRLAVGDTVEFRVASSATATINSGAAFIEMLQGPSQIAASEVIAMQAQKSAAQAVVGTGATVEVTNWLAAGIDTHSSFTPSTGEYRIPAPGLYRITLSLQMIFAATATMTARIMVNGSTIVYGNVSLPGTAAQLWNPQVTVLRRLNVGDIVRPAVSQNSTVSQNIDADAAINLFSVERLGGVG